MSSIKKYINSQNYIVEIMVAIILMIIFFIGLITLFPSVSAPKASNQQKVIVDGFAYKLNNQANKLKIYSQILTDGTESEFQYSNEQGERYCLLADGATLTKIPVETDLGEFGIFKVDQNLLHGQHPQYCPKDTFYTKLNKQDAHKVVFANEIASAIEMAIASN
jgi:hypothetical protein